MAKNLRAKIPASDTLIIHDRNKAATANFMHEVGIARDNPTSNNQMGLMGIEVATSPRAVADKAVRNLSLTIAKRPHYDEHVPTSMI